MCSRLVLDLKRFGARPTHGLQIVSDMTTFHAEEGIVAETRIDQETGTHEVTAQMSRTQRDRVNDHEERVLKDSDDSEHK